MTSGLGIGGRDGGTSRDTARTDASSARSVIAAGSDSYAAGREGQHDDLVLAVAPAARYRDYMHALIERAHAEEYGAATMAAERADRLQWPVGHPRRGGG